MQKLNGAQREAVTAPFGPVLVIAGPGSGKTLVLTHRVVYALENGIAPGKILALTFTTKAAEEMVARLEKLVGVKAGELWAGTFHSACLRIIRRHAGRLGYRNDFMVADEEDSLKYFKSACEQVGIDPRDRQLVLSLRQRVSALKNDLVEPADFRADEVRLYHAYQERLRAANMMDFDDLLVNTVRLLQMPNILGRWQKAFDFIVVDEFQDTNVAQYRIVSLLAERHRNVFVVGDPDQSIYTWRGAHPENIDTFLRDWPDAKIVKMEQNYRSTGNIVRAVNALIGRGAIEKNLWTSNPPGGEIVVYRGKTEAEEASFIVREVVRHISSGRRPQEIAVLVRTHSITAPIEEALAKRNVPYLVVGNVSFYSRREIKDAVAYLRLLFNPHDDDAFCRVVNVPPRGIGDKTLQKIIHAASSLGVSFYDASELVELPPRAKAGISNFRAVIEELSKMPFGETQLQAVLEQSGYIDMLRAEEDWERLENLSQLAGILRSKKGMGAVDFISYLATMADGDVRSGDAVRLMTVHAAKGLEFPVVFVAGLNENIFPHVLSVREGREDEEQRLMYVAMSRAEEHLYLTYTLYRWWAGQFCRVEPSSLLSLIPSETLLGSVVSASC
ncbi:MAG: UvrD-helicase domain-containing protein [Bacillota bacterium]